MYCITGTIHSDETGSPTALMELAYRLALDDSAYMAERMRSSQSQTKVDSGSDVSESDIGDELMLVEVFQNWSGDGELLSYRNEVEQ